LIYLSLICLAVAIVCVWIFAPLATTDKVGITTAASMVSLVILTGIYAWQTRRMADEMREQRLSEARPYLLLRLDLADDTLLQWDTHEGKKPPPNLAVIIENAGSGPARNLEASLWDSRYVSTSVNRGYLAQNEKWRVLISKDQIGIDGMVWLPELRDSIKKEYPGVVAVKYSDIHHRTWVSYLCLERHDVEAFVMDGEQNIVELKT
jgi:hypothetical protein